MTSVGVAVDDFSVSVCSGVEACISMSLGETGECPKASASLCGSDLWMSFPAVVDVSGCSRVVCVGIVSRGGGAFVLCLVGGRLVLLLRRCRLVRW